MTEVVQDILDAIATKRDEAFLRANALADRAAEKMQSGDRAEAGRLSTAAAHQRTAGTAIGLALDVCKVIAARKGRS